MLYSRKLTDHCKPPIMEKNKNHYIKKNSVSRKTEKKIMWTVTSHVWYSNKCALINKTDRGIVLSVALLQMQKMRNKRVT